MGDVSSTIDYAFSHDERIYGGQCEAELTPKQSSDKFPAEKFANPLIRSGWLLVANWQSKAR
jgi:hypothetical protein